MKKNTKKIIIAGVMALTLALAIVGAVGGGIRPMVDPPFGLINLK